MESRNYGGSSPLKVLATILLSIIVILSLAINLVFYDNTKTPHIFGKYFYLNETTDMEPTVSKNSLVFAKDEESYKANDIVIYKKTADDGSIIAGTMVITETGTSLEEPIYYLSSYKTKDSLVVKENEIVGACQSQSLQVGRIIAFVKSTIGIIALIILPIFIILLSVAIGIVRRRRDDDEIYSTDDFDDDDDELPEPIKTTPRQNRKPAAGANPLFNPDEYENSNRVFIDKKNSIEKNFKKKNIDADSDYQRTVNDESMQDSMRARQYLTEPRTVADKDEEETYTGKYEKSTSDIATEQPYRSAKSEPNTLVMDICGINNAVTETRTEPRRASKATETTIQTSRAEADADKRAAAIKIAIQKKREYEEAQRIKKEQQDALALQRAAAEKHEAELKLQRAAEAERLKAAVNSNRTPSKPRTTVKPAPKMNTVATFDDLMKVLDEEKKKLQ